MKRVLVVDDDSDIREVISEVLKGSGFAVDEAASAEAALIRLRQADYDVLLTDVEMSGQNGLALVRQVRAWPDHSPSRIVVMSGTARRSEAIAAGADEFLPKLFGADELLAVLDN